MIHISKYLFTVEKINKQTGLFRGDHGNKIKLNFSCGDHCLSLMLAQF